MKKPLFLFLLNTFSLVTLCAQNLPNTLLWRISGNGLQKPSYLYGTLHLSDERLSVLGDSLIQAIKNSDGFALELDPAQMSPMVIEVIRQRINHSAQIKNVLSEESYNRYAPALAKKFNKPADEITTDDVLAEKNKLNVKGNQKDKMVTFLDGYLCHLAYNQGKWIGGVEDYSVQIGLVDNLIDESDIRQMAISEGSSKDSSLDMLIRSYLNADLNSIDIMMNQADSAYRDKLLVSRNIRMAQRMDSLCRIRSMVFAVGCAHLPGKSGLIQLLKKAGYRVDPVFFSRKLTSAEYQIPERETSWVDVGDTSGNYHVSMPGTPAVLRMSGILQMKMYYDLFNNSAFLVSSFTLPFSRKQFDSAGRAMAQRIFGNHDGKDVVVNGLHGKEYLSNVEGVYKRGYIIDDNKMTYIAVGVEENASSKGQGVIDRFLHSFQPKKQINPEKSVAYYYTDSIMAFSIDLPAKPESGNDLIKSSDISTTSNLMISVDQNSGSYYMFSANNASRGYCLPNDSLIFLDVRKSLLKKLKNVNHDTVYIKDNRRIMEIDGEMEQAGFNFKTYYLFRGNRYYGLGVVYKKDSWDSNSERFFKSFRLLDYAKSNWKMNLSNDSLFGIWSPSPITYSVRKESETKTASIQYSMYDTCQSNSYDVLFFTYGKYYWQKNDSIWRKKLLDSYVGENDSLLYEKPVELGDLHGVEFVTQPKGAFSFSRRRIYLLGDSLLQISTTQQIENLGDKDIDRYFTNFNYNRPVPVSHIFKSKAALILSDLSSEDSITRTRAGIALKDAPFDSTDVPALCDELLRISEQTASDYETNQVRLTNQIIKYDDSHALAFARKNYPTIKNGEVKDDLLYIMCIRQTQSNYDSIAQLMVKFPMPKPLSMDLVNLFKKADSMTATMYPTILPLLRDTNCASSVVNIFNSLLDSNRLSMSMLKSHEQDILAYAERRFERKQKDSDDYSQGDIAILELVGKLQSPKGNAMLKQWLSVHGNHYLIYKAVKLLLSNNQDVSRPPILSLAKDRNFRTSVYDLLVKYHKQILFPLYYRTQYFFAESIAWAEVSEEDDPSNFVFLSQKKMLFEGKYYRFFFYKFSYSDTGETRMVCVGPFNVDPGSLSRDIASYEINDNAIDESGKLEEQEKALVRQMEDWYKF